MIALCSSFKEALICVDIDGKQDFCTLPANCKHSENVLPCVDKCLQHIGKNINDNDCFAVVVGPGSFTGIRIGISLVKGFIAGNNKFKILPITSFELIAYNYIKNNIIEIPATGNTTGIQTRIIPKSVINMTLRECFI